MQTIQCRTPWATILVSLSICGGAWAGGNILYVSPLGSHNTAGKYPDWAGAATNIASALAAAEDTDLVLVTNEIYALDTALIVDKGITVRGLTNQGPVILDGQWKTRCLRVIHSEAVVEGFQITRGTNNTMGGGLDLRAGRVQYCTLVDNTSGGRGGGAYCVGTLYACAIISNVAVTEGGGVFLEGPGDPALGLVDSCVVEGNEASRGGGIAAQASPAGRTAIITNCLIRGNTAVGYGGGGVSLNMFLTNVGRMELRNSTLCNNQATNKPARGGGIFSACALVADCFVMSNTLTSLDTYGGGLYSLDSTNRNTLIAYNTAASGGGISSVRGHTINCTVVSNAAVTGGGYIDFTSSSTGRVENTILYYNMSAYSSNYAYYAGGTTYYFNCCTAPPLADQSTNVADNIYSEPGFVSREAGRWQLTRDSGCVNAGRNQAWMDVASDLNLCPRKDRFSGIVDIGCYEYLPSGVLIIGW